MCHWTYFLNMYSYMIYEYKCCNSTTYLNRIDRKAVYPKIKFHNNIK